MIQLDSNSNDTITYDKKCASNMCETTDTMCVETNGGMTTRTQKFCVPDIGEHWLNKKSITNTLSLSGVADEHRVTLDTDEEKAFRVHFPRKIVNFKQLSNRLHGLKCLLTFLVM